MSFIYIILMAKAKISNKEKHSRLIKEINENNYLYHTLDKPKISDYEYDKLYDELLKLEEEDPSLISDSSPSQRVGFEPLENFEKQRHRIPMLSLQNSYSVEDIIEFDERTKRFLKTTDNIEYYCEPKLDGLAIELIYENGVLTSALTRGDGVTGENVVSNIKTISSIPLKLEGKSIPEVLEIRGEVLILKDDFKKLNDTQQEQGLAPLANPRNAAAGTIRQLDPKIAASRSLRMYSYAYGEISKKSFKSQAEFVDFLDKNNFPTVQAVDPKLVKLCKNANEAVEYYKDIEKRRNKLAFDIDGIVIKVNSLKTQEELGTIARSPRWASAAKFKPEQATTVIEDIIIQTGRTGALTPVAIMKPTKVGGVVVSNATLHNQDEIDRKDIRKGDTVIIHRAGDVIPEVVKVIVGKRKKGSKKFVIPETCPSCGSKASKTESEVVLRCTNSMCPAVIKEGLKHFVSRRAMNIDKLGDRLIDQLADHELIKNFSDIYKLTSEQLIELDRQGKKSVANIISSIEASKDTNLARFIYSLGMRFVGEQTARTLASNYKTLNNFLKAKEEDLLEIDDIGPKVAQSILNSLKNKSFIEEVKKLEKSGLNLNTDSEQSSSKQTLKDLAIVVTGTLPEDRNKIKDLIMSLGGKSPGSVSKKTDYLLAGEAAGSKLEKANDLNVPVINWDEFQKLIKGDR